MARITISIPDGLKERMDAYTDPVKWSQVAAHAFERKLAQEANIEMEDRMIEAAAHMDPEHEPQDLAELVKEMLPEDADLETREEAEREMKGLVERLTGNAWKEEGIPQDAKPNVVLPANPSTHDIAKAIADTSRETMFFYHREVATRTLHRVAMEFLLVRFQALLRSQRSQAGPTREKNHDLEELARQCAQAWLRGDSDHKDIPAEEKQEPFRSFFLAAPHKRNSFFLVAVDDGWVCVRRDQNLVTKDPKRVPTDLPKSKRIYGE